MIDCSKPATGGTRRDTRGSNSGRSEIHRFLCLIWQRLSAHEPVAVRGAALWVLFACGACLPAWASAEPAPASGADGRDTAVALNYCRAAFHRIRRNPSQRVLVEERERILNNLNLNRIADEEVIRLYTAVLDEIGDIQIAEKERDVVHRKHGRVFFQQLAGNSLAFGMQLAAGQMVAAARTGAGSWWDYRTMVFNREVDTWKIEKERMESVLGKSSQFLDTFWKLARKRDIPDDWLVRENDLDRLEEALQIADLPTRLRVLKRMDRFLETYPPYLYYVGRTQQQMGQLFAAAKTYEQLVQLGAGHFRKDELLAAALANQAVIQAYLQQPHAAETARRALGYSAEVWQANLMCASVLGRAGDFQTAEDAVLRNLDVGLERDYSRVSLAWLYYSSGHQRKLAGLLENPDVVRGLPAALLVACAGCFEPDALPAPVTAWLEESLDGCVDLKFGKDDFILRATPAWQLESAQVTLELAGRRFSQPRLVATETHLELHFARVAELGAPLSGRTLAEEPAVEVAYAEGPTLRLRLQRGAAAASSARSYVIPPATARTERPVLPPRGGTLHIAAVESLESQVTVRPYVKDGPTSSALVR